MIKHTPLQNGNDSILSPICPMGAADTLGHDRVFPAALMNGCKIQIFLQLQYHDLTWRVASIAHWNQQSSQESEPQIVKIL